MGYLVGDFIPYFVVGQQEVGEGLNWSIGIMAVVLVLFGYVKTWAVGKGGGKENIKAGLRGAAAAGISVALIRAIDRTLH